MSKRSFHRFSWIVLCATWVSACSTSSLSQEGLGPTSVKCQASIAGMPSSFSAAGGQIGARVLTSPECPWSATTTAAWMDVNPPAGQGETDVTVRIARNELPASRTASVQVNGVQLTLAQEAAVVQPDPIPSPAPPAPPTPSPAPAPAPPAPTPPPSQPNPTPPSPAPPASSGVDIAGVVSGLSGSCPVLTFSVAGRPVVTDNNTKFTQGNCKQMSNGLTIHVIGTATGSGTVHATQVEMNNHLSEVTTSSF